MPAKVFVSDDRILALEVMEGKKPISSIGASDARLFTGENKVHALKDSNGLWSLRFDKGITPQALQGRFTSFQKAYDHAETFFNRRNVNIKEIIDG